MKFADATNTNRKSGVAEWRDLRFLFCAIPAKEIGRVPHVRNSVRGPKTMGDPDFLQRGGTNVRVCGFH